MRKLRFILLALTIIITLILAFSLSGCSDDSEEVSSEVEESSMEDEAPAEYPVDVEGVTIMSKPDRVISLSPALTEKLYDAGLESFLVGVSSFCDYPEAALSLPVCGTAQIPDIDKIKSLNPHVILTQVELSEEDLIAVQQMGADVVVIPAASSIEEFKQSYKSLIILFEGKYTGEEMSGEFLANIDDRLDFLRGYLVPYAEENGMKDALYLRMMDFNVATGDTLENELMETIGLKNIAESQTGWLYPEDLAKDSGRADFESVDVIFMDEKFVNIKMLEQSQYYKGLQATLKDWYLYIDCLTFERQSLRMLDILESMAAYAYPDASPDDE